MAASDDLEVAVTAAFDAEGVDFAATDEEEETQQFERIRLGQATVGEPVVPRDRDAAV